MSVSFDIKFFRRDLEQHKNNEVCRASPTCFCSSLINLIPKDTNMVFYLSWTIRKLQGINSVKNGEKQLLFCSNLTSQMYCDVSWRRHLTNKKVAITSASVL